MRVQVDPSRPASEPTATADGGRGLLIPRGLVMLAALWIFLAWIYLFGFRPPVQPQAASYAPSIRLLFAAIGVGIAVGWPLLRLSSVRSLVPRQQAAIDALSVFVLLQVVLWPLRLVTDWTIPRTVAVDAALGASITLTAAILAATQGSATRAVRSRAMLLSVGLVVMPWAIAIVSEWTGGWMAGDGWLRIVTASLSAPTLLGSFAQPATLDPSDADRVLILVAWGAACAAWIVAAVLGAIERKPASPPATRPDGPTSLD